MKTTFDTLNDVTLNDAMRAIASNPPTRYKAAGIHFGLSMLVAIILVALMLFLWYPSPYFAAMGGAKLLILIVSIDVVVGPIITLIIFNPKKKSLPFDLAVVACLQLAAFVYGASVMYDSRPVYNVYYNGRFDVVSPSRVPMEEFAKVKLEEFKQLPLTGPKLVAAQEPATVAEINHIVLHKTATADIAAFPQYLVPYETNSPNAKEAGLRAKPLAELRQKDPSAIPTLDTFIKDHNLEAGKVGYLPVVTRKTNMVAIVDRASGKLHGFVFANPW
jgi:hypothetical protein